MRRAWLVLPILYVVACDPAPADTKKADTAGTTKVADGEQKQKPPEPKAEAKVPDVKAPAVGEGPDPCALVSRVRAGEALRSPVQDGVRSGNACKWKATTGPGSVVIEVTGKDGANVYAREKKLLGADEDVPDLGTAAFLTGSIVGVHVGDRYVSIAVAPNIGQGPLAKPADTVQLAKDAIAALPE